MKADGWGWRWYAVRVLVGHEVAIGHRLLEVTREAGMASVVTRVTVPMGSRWGGNRIGHPVLAKMAPGWVFLRVSLEEGDVFPSALLAVVAGVPGVGGFEGLGDDQPRPVGPAVAGDLERNEWAGARATKSRAGSGRLF